MPADFIAHYKIIKELGRGGMGVVYLAQDTQFKQKQVALKVIDARLAKDAQSLKRFDREAAVLAALEHAAIVPVHSSGRHEGQPYLVMRYMRGGSLKERIGKKGLPLKEVSQLVTRIAPALDKAGQRGIVHRDLKPDNILYDEDDAPYVSDFGIAKIAASEKDLTTSVQDLSLSGGLIVGTPAYMSPEQGLGRPDVDARSDQYSLGVVVYQMLTGQYLFDAETDIGMVMAHINTPPPDVLKVRPGLPKQLGKVMDKVLSKDPAKRYNSSREFAAALEAVAKEGAPVTKRVNKPAKPQQAAAWLRQNRQLLAAAGAVALLAVLLTQLPRPTTTAVETQTTQMTVTKAETDAATIPSPVTNTASPTPPSATPVEQMSTAQPTLESPLADFIGNWTTTTHPFLRGNLPVQLELEQKNQDELVLTLIYEDGYSHELTEYALNETSRLAITFYSNATYYHLSLTDDNDLRLYSRYNDRTVFYSKDETDSVEGQAQVILGTQTATRQTFLVGVGNISTIPHLTLFVGGAQYNTFQNCGASCSDYPNGYPIYVPEGIYSVYVCVHPENTECGQLHTVEVKGPMEWRFQSLNSITFRPAP